MAESTLSIDYSDLEAEVGAFLHHGPDPSEWSARQSAQVDRIIQAGLRQFYYPPAMEGVELGYRWSFMQPTTTIATVADTSTYDLPDDFGSITGQFQYEVDKTFLRGVTQVSIGQILELQQHDDDSGKPRHFATRFKTSDGSDGQRHEVIFWPTPDAAYTLTYRYDAYAGKIDKHNYPYPLGGMKHSETLIESCLAVAESRGNDEDGQHARMFQRMMASAVALDRRNFTQRYGQMGGNEDHAGNGYGRGKEFISGDVTYNGDTW